MEAMERLMDRLSVDERGQNPNRERNETQTLDNQDNKFLIFYKEDRGVKITKLNLLFNRIFLRMRVFLKMNKI